MPTDREIEHDRFVALRDSGATDLREALIADHLWLARHCARRFAGRGEQRDDLLQVASLALVNAVDRFDPDLGVRFTTFAMPTIVGELRRHFRDRSWSVRVARRLKDLHVELRSAREELTHVLGRAPSVDELADFVDATPDEVLEALEAGAAYRASTLSSGPLSNDGRELEEPSLLGVDDTDLNESPERLLVQQALQALPERDRKVVYLSFYAGLTQSEIAEEVGVSQVHVSRILRASMAKLGEELDGDPKLEGTDEGS